jgi:O-acetylserine/cysteine efflux transporter
VGSIGALLLLALIWGGSVPLTKLGLRDFPPFTLTALRYLGAAPFFILFLAGRPLPPPRVLAAAAGLGVLGPVAGQALQTFGVRETSASAATVISSLIPLLLVIFVVIRLHQPLRAQEAAGLIVAFVGISLVATGSPRNFPVLLSTPGIRGDAMMLLSALAIALYYVLSLELIERYSVLTVAALTSLAGACGLAPIAAWELRSSVVRVDAEGIAVVLYLAVLVTVAGLWIWFRALRVLPASMVAALQYLQPLVGVAVSAVLFGDRLGVWFWAGTGLVLLGIASTTRVRSLSDGLRP